jgi:hypothetical protein
MAACYIAQIMGMGVTAVEAGEVGISAPYFITEVSARHIFFSAP